MAGPVVGICGVGVMGSAVGRRLREDGLLVLSSSEGRSPATKARIIESGLEDVGSLDRLVERSDVVLSIMGSETAMHLAGEVLRSVKRTQTKDLVFVDCNLVEPAALKELERSMLQQGLTVVDAGIVGPPPDGVRAPQLYLSGPRLEEVLFLRDHGFPVEVVGDEVGAASALKVCSAAVWQGCLALITDVALTAHSYDIGPAFLADLQHNQSPLYDWFVPALEEAPPRASRWEHDMRAISRVMANAGSSGQYHSGAAELYSRMAAAHIEDAEEATSILERMTLRERVVADPTPMTGSHEPDSTQEME